MKNFIRIALAALLLFPAMLQAQESYTIRAWHNGSIVWQSNLATVDSLDFIAEEIPKATYTITLHADATMGSAVGADTYQEGDTATIVAFANNGYRFAGWSDGVQANSRTIIVTNDVTLTANFEATAEQTLNGYAYVDLGLPSGNLWATCNIGASSPEAYGNFYFQYDAPSWGSTWHTPTATELQELLDHCTWTWITRNDTKGFYISGTNGHHIFLPAAGDINSTTSSHNYAGQTGYYWTSSSYEDGRGYYLTFYSTYKVVGYSYGYSWLQMSIRLVSSAIAE